MGCKYGSGIRIEYYHEWNYLDWKQANPGLFFKMKKENTLHKVRLVFRKYLEDHNLRKTPERFLILDEIYSHDGHLDVELLLQIMKEKKFSISKATIYNTLEHLSESNLVTKHQFGSSNFKFEKSYQNKQHDHLICTDCGKVFEFCDPRIQQIQSITSAILNFKITHHSLNFYGNCLSKEKNGHCVSKDVP